MSDDRLASTLADIRSLKRWFRAKNGVLYNELMNGTIGLVDGGVPSFRQLLTILDGPDSGLAALELDEPWEREIRALFSVYRRLCRAERRLADEVTRER